MRRRFLYILILIFFSGSIHFTNAQNDLTVREIVFKGNDSIADQSLAGQMNTREATLGEKMKFWSRNPVFSEKTLQEDISRLETYYQRQGFLTPEMDYKIHERQNGKSLAVHIHINEGEAYRIQDITYDDPDVPQRHLSLTQIQENRVFNKGDRFVDYMILAHESQIRTRLKNHGYAFAEVGHNIQFEQNVRAANIHFTIQPHSLTYFGRIRLDGDTLVSEEFVRKQLNFKPGDVYSEQKISDAQKRLFNTDLFNYIVIHSDKKNVSGDSIPITVKMEERPPWSLEAGVGYGTEDRLRLSAQLTKLQFLGETRKFLFIGRRSYYLPIDLETKIIQYNLFFDNLDLIVNPFFIRENEESYRIDRLGGGITLQQTFSDKTSGYILYSMERDFLKNKTELDTLTGRFRDDIHNKSGITVGFVRNTANNLFSPSRGGKLKGHVTYMGLGFQSRYHYFRIEAEADRYYELYDNWVLAGKLRVGLIESLKNTEPTPIEDRFLLGGASSLRGWGRHQVSPVNEQGQLIGGNSMLETSIELRFPIYDIFSGVVFSDLGNVWRKSYDYDLSQLRYNAGLGFRAETPIGPVRLDIATPILKDPFRVQFFISIGHAF